MKTNDAHGFTCCGYALLIALFVSVISIFVIVSINGFNGTIPSLIAAKYIILSTKTETSASLRPASIRHDSYCVQISVAGISFTSIPKNMSTMTKLILCDLLNLFNKGRKRNQNCSHLSYPSVSERRWEPTERRSFLIVRDPIDRFTSMFGHICLRAEECGSDGQSVHAMAKNIYLMLTEGQHPPGATNFHHLKHHFEPHTWFCDVAKHIDDYFVIHYSHNIDENVGQFKKLFEISGVPETYADQTLKRMQTESTHSDRNDTMYEMMLDEIYSNQETLSYIVASYYYDYKLLKIPFPKGYKLNLAKE